MKRITVWLFVVIGLSVLPALWATRVAGADSGNPILSVPFDVSRENSVVEENFSISQFKVYFVEFLVSYTSQNEIRKMGQLLGGMGYGPGIIVPIQAKISEINNQGVPEKVLFDQRFDTSGWSTHQIRDDDNRSGEFGRIILNEGLKPGVYHLSIKTLAKSPAFMNMPVRLIIGFKPNVNYIQPNK